MNYKKHVSFFVIAFMIMLFGMKNVNATNDYTADILCRPDTTLLGANTPGELTTTIKVFKQKGSSNWAGLAYCTGGYEGNMLTWAPNGGTYNNSSWKKNMTQNGEFLPAGVLYLINNSGITYNYNKAINCNASSNADYSRKYYITQISIWKYLKDKGYNISGISNINSDYKKTNYASEIKNKVDIAKTKNYPTYSMRVEYKKYSNNQYFELGSDGYYITQPITIKYELGNEAGVGATEYSGFDIILKNAPAGTKLVYSDGTEIVNQTKIKNNQFKIKFPASTIHSFTKQLVVSITGHFTIKKAYEVGTSDNRYQPIVLVGNFSSDNTQTKDLTFDVIPSCDCESNDYKCAMNYCDNIINVDENDRRNCVVNKCKIDVPEFVGCADTKPDSKDSTCAASSTSSSNTCTYADVDTFYSTSCSEKNNLTYNTTLPKTIMSGQGFWYSVKLDGSRQCTTTFSGDRWNFEYAVSNNKIRGDLKSKLDNYVNNVKNDSNNYKYDSSSADVKMEIKETISNSSEKKVSNKTLRVVNKYDEKMEFKGQTNDKTFIDIVNDKAHNINYSFTSTMASIYMLPDVCIDEYGKVNDAKKDDNGNYVCSNALGEPFNKFYADNKAVGKSDTKVIVSINYKGQKEQVSQNTCHYTISNPVICTVTSNGDNKYTLTAISDYAMDFGNLKYSLSSTSTNDSFESFNGESLNSYSKTFDKSPGVVYGKIIDSSNNIIATCSTGKCPISSEISPTDYEGIRKYCENNFVSSGFDNVGTCYETCSVRSCKLQYSCSNNTKIDEYNEKIKNYCRDIENLKEGTDEYAQCMSECSCKTDSNYVYRPIDLSNPFPNRNPGWNWLGYNYLLKERTNKEDEKSTYESQYVVKLNSQNIKDIKSYNKGKNYTDYDWLNPEEKNGIYTSKFIHDSFSSLFKIKDGSE